ncbi:TetR/AcrR family transcriptional regulator [Paenibacillus sp. N1-5-1-14]|uniref:TetR/AcrR family transcriptional regulator n=1 Tax=Paenibacillus radicibacter TaxID=2972488 RepID=UPI002158D005|nr:TetR/AcrR family transcriptional regulator [Paenibacillus radicibacter]MCR8641239.1 TetR/AcrR family transcriptional regulator [Paenibacillus radicibacter]
MVQDKVAKKKEQILITAMKLFSMNGYHNTSMQEIAKICEMSKGSLYVHFKSKEELFFHIFKYYIQMLDDRLQEIDQEMDLTEKERIAELIKAQLTLVLEMREFIMMQMRENIGNANHDVQSFLHQKKLEGLNLMHKRLLNVYGEAVRPYVCDVAMLFDGMVMEYLSAMIIAQFPLEVQSVSQFLLRQLDSIVETMLRDQPEPLIREEAWAQLIDRKLSEEIAKPHPLVMIKEMKDSLKELDLDRQQQEDALQALLVLENELKELQPRRVVMLGMLNILCQIPKLRNTANELSVILIR